MIKSEQEPWTNMVSHQVHQHDIKGIKEGEEGKELKIYSKSNLENFPH